MRSPDATILTSRHASAFGPRSRPAADTRWWRTVSSAKTCGQRPRQITGTGSATALNRRLCTSWQWRVYDQSNPIERGTWTHPENVARFSLRIYSVRKRWRAEHAGQILIFGKLFLE